MKVAPMLVVIVSSLFFLNCARSPEALTQRRIAGVEQGLLSDYSDPPWKRMELLGRMQHYRVPGVTIAVIDEFQIEWTKEYGVLEWMNWDQFQKLAGQQTNTGVPGVATIHNAFDEGSLQVHAIPDAYTEDNFDLRIHQYEQVLIPDSETDVFQLPYPMIEGIVDGGRYRLLLEREPEGGRMGHCLAQFKVQVDQSRTLDRKQNNAPRDGAFRLEIF